MWVHASGETILKTLPTDSYVQIALIALVRPITLNFTEPMVFLLNLYIALIYGLLYIWFESFPIVFEGIYKFNLDEEGLAFVGILLGAILVIPPFFYYLYKVVEPQFNENGELKPEKRLPPAFVGAFCIPICLFWFGWSARPSIHWIMPIIGSGFFAVGTFLLFNSVLNYLPDAYPEYAASVLAGNDFMRSSFGAGFPLFATAMYKNLGVGWASSTLGFLSIAFIPIPFLLYRVSRARPCLPFLRNKLLEYSADGGMFSMVRRYGSVASMPEKTFRAGQNQRLLVGGGNLRRWHLHERIEKRGVIRINVNLA